MAEIYFSVKEANGLIPTIKKELAELQKLQKLSQYKFSQLNKVKDRNQPDKVKRDSAFTLECELDFIEIVAHLHVLNIRATGAHLKGIDPGLVYFPSKMNGEEVFLSWKQGEEEISHYQLEHEGTTGRKLLE
ncbi:DUF2203 domain-containing protein [Evansella tamaricis]|uniref:DUF2203 domain-containing protein n=1 Tax=Evansella tamaricis TaxID=2069301 RepID=A0ABS6JMG9_9BACI|nr:DUF2203 domain-containing protein [Evansella tamaricis]MBU9714874.1 DUF2203 domain-containing protein [Evansella tamaricis]